ncbi:MAG: hypothetical protein ABUS56_06610 [Acidobacteriota bacterium]
MRSVLPRHDDRYVPSYDPRAVLRAWSGSDGQTDLGGWTEPDEDAFRRALQELSREFILARVVIERID